MNDAWLDLWEEEESEDELIREFEKLLYNEDNNYEELKNKTTGNNPDECSHIWKSTGRSPVLDTPWFNCEKCGIKKETHEKSI